MTGKQIAILVVAILVVSVSLYSALKPVPVVEAEQPVLIQDARVVKEVETFSFKVRQLAAKRSLYSLHKHSSPDGEFFINESIKDMRSFDQKGWRVMGVYNTQKEPTLYTCKVTNDAGQHGGMMLKSLNGKKWLFVAFAIDKQKSED